MSELSQAARDVLTERRRQIEAKGWTPAHDDTHVEGQMAGAAACYALYRSQVSPEIVMGESLIQMIWPWSSDCWTPTTPRRDLVKAGALILAEIERLDRKATLERGSGDER